MILEVDVAVEIVLEASELGIARPVGGAAVRRDVVAVRDLTQTREELAGLLVVVLHDADRVQDGREGTGGQLSADPLLARQFVDRGEQQRFFLGHVRRHVGRQRREQPADFAEFGVSVAVALDEPIEPPRDDGDGVPHVAVVRVDDVPGQAVQISQVGRQPVVVGRGTECRQVARDRVRGDAAFEARLVQGPFTGAAKIQAVCFEHGGRARVILHDVREPSFGEGEQGLSHVPQPNWGDALRL